MELTYILIAAAIIVLPFVLTKLLSGKPGDTAKVMGAYTPAQKPAAATVGTEGLADRVKALLAQGKKLEAIKLAREKTGLPLEAAKEMVETIGKAGSAAHDAGFSLKETLAQAKELNDQVQHLVAQGDKIEAIKLIRERTGLGLKEAKDLVDRLG